MSVALATAYRCGNDERLAAVRNAPGLNGIEAVELVVPPGDLVELPRQLLVVFVDPIDPVPTTDMISIVSRATRRPLDVVSTAPTFDPRTVAVTLAAAGDLSDYELRLIDPADPDRPPAGIDPVLGRCRFSFGVVCQTDVDCEQVERCEPVADADPTIDRLARDYPGFRRLLLDRVGLLQPDWTDRNAADVRVALVELLAYVGDQLSYQQDAIATEAYLGTARHRVSARRHARLVDYRMHDGASARAFVQLEISPGAALLNGPNEARGALFLTGPAGGALDASTERGARTLARRLDAGDLVFQVARAPGATNAALAPDVFAAEHNSMTFHTWNGEECCLPSGATGATLAGHLPDLAVGDVLVLAERRDPTTGEIADANPARRHAVRLTAVDAGTAPNPLTDPATGDPITEISWDDDDALPFPLVVSVTVGDAPAVTHLDATVAMGNVVLAEHGRPAPPETLDVPAPGRPWRPRLGARDITQSTPLPDASWSAAAIGRAAPSEALAAVRLTHDGTTWTVTDDLIGAGDDARMVVEVDDDGGATLRFGASEPDGTFRHGRPPRPAVNNPVPATVEARTGTGAVGNVGAEAIGQMVTVNDATVDAGPALRQRIAGIRNPLAAWGGADPETIESVRQRAPFAFNVQERAVTAADYARRAEAFADRQPDGDGVGVQRAVAQLRWTGSWHTVFVAVDRAGGRPVDAAFEERLRRHLDPYRMAGHDVEIEPAIDVPLEVRLVVELSPATFRSVALDRLTDLLSNRRLADGRLGLFHPDRLTFAQTVYLSPIVAAAQGVAGVQGVTVTRFGRYRQPAIERREHGFITVGRNEIARLDNDPSRPERGVLEITLAGGR